MANNIQNLYGSVLHLKRDFKVDWKENTKADWKVDWPVVVVSSGTGTSFNSAANSQYLAIPSLGGL